MRVLILEDNCDRKAAMTDRLRDRFPFLQIVFFEASADMIDFMQAEALDDVALIALDHDLEMIPGSDSQWIDPGTGLDVAQWLAERPEPICPVVVHTTNCPAGDQMTHVLGEAQWTTFRVVPYDDLRWIDADWFPLVRNAIVDFTPKPIASPRKDVPFS